MEGRRLVLKGLAGLPLATVFGSAVFKGGRAFAAQDSERLADPAQAAASVQMVSRTIAVGHKVSAALALPRQTPAPAVMLVHEWWGLNDEIKAMAREFADHGYVALAIDLFDGKIATTPEAAKALVSHVDNTVATETVTAWISWLRSDRYVAGKDAAGKVATLGWCFGGGWALNAALATPVDATVIYYGSVTQPKEDLAKLKGPVLGHFGTQDKVIDREMVKGFEDNMAAIGKTPTVYWYNAGHAFANPTGKNYAKDDTKLAWGRTMAFLSANLIEK
ncbi:MAG: dienelactone hydrolase family protein [Alphaproteobacteria bacterium]|nr:dienelactone hydrolase family protein [Alphaproteobacteria bacterium]